MPLGLVISLSYLCILLGWSALVGFACMAITFPVPTLLYMRYAKLQQGVMKRTDERIGMVGELLNSVRVVKYFGWERAMMGRIDEKRDAEQKMIWKRMPLGITCLTFRCHAVDLDFICQQSTSLDQFDCNIIHVYCRPKTRIVF